MKVVLNGNVFYRGEAIRIWIYLANKGKDVSEIASAYSHPDIYIYIYNETNDIEKKLIYSSPLPSSRTWRLKGGSEILLWYTTIEVEKYFSTGRHLLNVTVVFTLKCLCTILMSFTISGDSYYPLHALIDTLIIFIPAALIFLVLYVLPKILISNIISKK